jgi:hypothetical protein
VAKVGDGPFKAPLDSVEAERAVGHLAHVEGVPRREPLDAGVGAGHEDPGGVERAVEIKPKLGCFGHQTDVRPLVQLGKEARTVGAAAV